MIKQKERLKYASKIKSIIQLRKSSHKEKHGKTRYRMGKGL
jgi:hypothetical protein